MKASHKLSVVFLKFAPMIGGLLMWIHVSLLLLGLKSHLAENLIGLPIIPCITCIIWSRAFGFCSMHRHFIAYICLVTYCINWQADFMGFGNMLLLARVGVWMIGLVLLVWFFIKWKKNNYKICKDEQIKYN